MSLHLSDTFNGHKPGYAQDLRIILAYISGKFTQILAIIAQ